MRKREEIENGFFAPDLATPTDRNLKLVLEVLLDIRELLEEMDHNLSQLEGKICRNIGMI